MKGFIDRLFVPTIAFKYRPNSVWWDKLFTGRSARIITTLDQPSWYYWLFYGRPSVNQLKNSILQFCGITPVRVSYVGTVRNSTDRQREKWLNEMYELGKKWN
jgi:NAD(P)H dehydrogenase (quinone)